MITGEAIILDAERVIEVFDRLDLRVYDLLKERTLEEYDEGGETEVLAETMTNREVIETLDGRGQLQGSLTIKALEILDREGGID